METLVDAYRLRKAISRIGNPHLGALVEFTLGGCMDESAGDRDGSEDEWTFILEALADDFLNC